MKVLYYAVGGGLGHLVRARAFLQAYLPGHAACVLSASPYADDARVLQGIDCLRVPQHLERDTDALRAWLRAALQAQTPDLVCIDSFPGGILGELCDFALLARVRTWHIARLLRWEQYDKVLLGAPPRYARSFRLEPLLAAHEAFLAARSDEIQDCVLPAESTGGDQSLEEIGPYWLVVHSGPEAEVAELLDYALELQRARGTDTPILVATPNAPRNLPARCRAIDRYPATPLFAPAEHIVSAAGFNVLRQTAAYRHKQSILPFPRRYDDQYLRASRAAASPALL